MKRILILIVSILILSTQVSAQESEKWNDIDGDGDIDVIVVVDKKLNKKHLQNAKREIEKATNGKIDMHFIIGTEQTTLSKRCSFMYKYDRKTKYIPKRLKSHKDMMYKYLDNWRVKGLTIAEELGNKNTIVIIKNDNARTVLHELMHVIGVTEDEDVNNGDSIMDYNYSKDVLTNFDKKLLNKLYK
jgi:hypothetical protein